MAKCKKCGQEIDFMETSEGTLYPVDLDKIGHEDLEMGQRLITVTGILYAFHPEKSYPNVRGYLVHFDSCIKETTRLNLLGGE